MAAGFFGKLKKFLGKVALFGAKLLQNKTLNNLTNAATLGIGGTVSNKIGGALESILNKGGIT